MTETPPATTTPPAATTTPVGSTPLTGLTNPGPTPPPATITVVPTPQPGLAQIQNFAHMALAVLAALVLAAQGIVESLHQTGVDTSGADWRLVAISSGVLLASKAVDSFNNAYTTGI